MLRHLEIPGVSLNLQDPLLRLTGRHPRQTGGTSIGQVSTDCARGGGVRPVLTTPGPARGTKEKRQEDVLIIDNVYHPVLEMYHGL